MNFRDLQYIIAVASTLSFSRAAEACNVSQPSLSMQIKKLEAELGIQLFIRNNRRVQVSAMGKIVLDRAQQILTLKDEISNFAQANNNVLKGTINLGAILTVAPYVFPAIIQITAVAAPDTTLILKEAKTEDLLKGLLSEEIDAAIVSLPTDDNVFESQALFTDPLYVAVAASHPLASRQIISAGSLENEALILLEEGHCLRKQALEICCSISAHENKMLQASSLETIKSFVSIGQGLTLMPSIAKKNNDGICYIPLQNNSFSRTIGLVWKKASAKAVLISQLLGLMHTLYMSDAA